MRVPRSVLSSVPLATQGRRNQRLSKKASLSLGICFFAVLIVPSPGWQTALVASSLLSTGAPTSSLWRLQTDRDRPRSCLSSCFGSLSRLVNRRRIMDFSSCARELRALPQHMQRSSQSEATPDKKTERALKKEQKKREKQTMLKLQTCMKSKDVATAMETFSELKEGDADKRLSPHVYSIMINLLGGNQQLDDALVMFNELKVFHGTPPESAYATMMRAACEAPAPNLSLAEALLAECVEKDVPIKLRVVQPLLSRLLVLQRLPDFFSLLHRILDVQPLLFSISASSSVAPVEGLLVEALEECGRALGGEDEEEVAGWVDELLGYMAANCLAVTRASAERMAGALEGRAAVVKMEGEGRCPRTGAQVERLELRREERGVVRAALLEIAGALGEEHRAKLEGFGEWIRGRSPAFTAVIDAPNVAYARQNFEGGCFSYHQIDLVLRELQARGHRTLVLLPWKYLQPVIPNHARFQPASGGSVTLGRHEVTVEEQRIIDRWEEEEVLAASPYGANDDWYWMMASVAADAGGLAVISNDHMRDHRLFLLEPRPFLRWKSTQILRFDLDHAYEPARIASGEIEAPTVTLSDPPQFSREIQRLDGSAEGRGVTWHVPIMLEDVEGEALQPQHAEQACASTALVASGPEEQEWLSIALDGLPPMPAVDDAQPQEGARPAS